MTQESSIQKVLHNILSTQSYDKLHQFVDESSWHALSVDEKELLAQAFVLAAEKIDPAVGQALTIKQSLDVAVALAPMNARVWYRRGLIVSFIQESGLQEACLCFEKALSIDSSFFDAWYAWGNILMRRGIIARENHFFYEADKKFTQAKEALEKSMQNTQFPADFFWHWGLLAFLIARTSGEATDLHAAIQRYSEAQKLGLTRKDFYNDFANALVEFAVLVNQQSLIFDAVELYLKSLDVDGNQEKPQELAIRYFNLGCCYQYLFEIHFEEAFFFQAQDAYEKSIALGEFLPAVWSNWAYLLFFGARVWQDATLIESSLEKWNAIPLQEQEDLITLSRRLETLALCGRIQDNPSFMKEAERIAHLALQREKKVPELWIAYGRSLYELGCYFDEAEYFSRIIASCEEGVALHPLSAMLWYVMGIAKVEFGKRCDMVSFIEEGVSCFQRCAKTELGRFGHFWNDWGVTLLTLASIDGDNKYLYEAQEKLEQAILVQEYIHPEWLLDYGCTLDLLGDVLSDESFYERAIQAFSYALSLDSTLLSAKYHLAIASMHLGETNGDAQTLHFALENLQSIIDEDTEEQPWNEIGLVYLHLATLSLNDQERKEYLDHAEPYFAKALLAGEVDAYYNRACMYAMQNNAAEAIVCLEKAEKHHAITSIQEILDDEWLDSIKGTAAFRAFIERR